MYLNMLANKKITKLQNEEKIDNTIVYNSVYNLESVTEYAISLSVAKCEDDWCDGSGTITIKDADTKKVKQIIKCDNLFFDKESVNKTSRKDISHGPVIFGDFNFDKNNDIAVINFSKNQPQGQSYDVYLFDPIKKLFVFNQNFTDLASQYLGMFSVDTEKSTLTTFTKSGCCWHQTFKFKVINNTPVVFYKLTEDARSIIDTVIVTEEELINGSWVTTKKQVPAKEYYKN